MSDNKADNPIIKTLEELAQYLTAQTAENKFSGVALVAQDGKPVFHQAYGLANKRYNVPNQLDTKFNLGSINKLFTIISILQLMEKESLALEDTLGKFRPDFPPEVGDKVTIRHLLRHEAGLGDYFDHATYQATWPTLKKIEDYVAFIKDTPLEFEPGEDDKYSNSGFLMLGAVIEAATGGDYYDYVRENIYHSAGMMDTDSYEMDAVVENLAMGYTYSTSADGEESGSVLKENIFMHSARGTSAGGGFSTTGDLLKFDQALRGFKLLSPRSVGLWFNQYQPLETPPAEFAAEFMVAGGAPGICAAYGVKPASAAIVLSNYDPPEAVDIASMIMKMPE